MNRTYTRAILALTVAAVAALVALAPAVAANAECTVEITIDPATLKLDSGGKVVTGHAGIPYDEVHSAELYLRSEEGINAIPSWRAKADNAGDFVFNFYMDAIKDLPALELNAVNEFVLMGIHETGYDAFCGITGVMIRDDDAGPSGPKRSGQGNGGKS